MWKKYSIALNWPKEILAFHRGVAVLLKERYPIFLPPRIPALCASIQAQVSQSGYKLIKSSIKTLNIFGVSFPMQKICCGSLKVEKPCTSSRWPSTHENRHVSNMGLQAACSSMDSPWFSPHPVFHLRFCALPYLPLCIQISRQALNLSSSSEG